MLSGEKKPHPGFNEARPTAGDSSLITGPKFTSISRQAADKQPAEGLFQEDGISAQRTKYQPKVFTTCCCWVMSRELLRRRGVSAASCSSGVSLSDR